MNHCSKLSIEMRSVQMHIFSREIEIPHFLVTETKTIRLRTTSCISNDIDRNVIVLKSFQRLETLELFHDRLACDDEILQTCFETSKPPDYCSFGLRDMLRKIVTIIFHPLNIAISLFGMVMFQFHLSQERS